MSNICGKQGLIRTKTKNLRRVAMGERERKKKRARRKLNTCSIEYYRQRRSGIKISQMIMG